MNVFRISNWVQRLIMLFNRGSHIPSIPIGPYSLVQLVHQGEWLEQAPDSASSAARVLVKRAVKARLVTRSALLDTAYLDAIETALLVHTLLRQS